MDEQFYPQPARRLAAREGRDFELVLSGFSHRSNSLSIAGGIAFLHPAQRMLRTFFFSANLLLSRAI
jgi:hypothetical protein